MTGNEILRSRVRNEIHSPRTIIGSNHREREKANAVGLSTIIIPSSVDVEAKWLGTIRKVRLPNSASMNCPSEW